MLLQEGRDGAPLFLGQLLVEGVFCQQRDPVPVYLLSLRHDLGTLDAHKQNKTSEFITVTRTFKTFGELFHPWVAPPRAMYFLFCCRVVVDSACRHSDVILTQGDGVGLREPPSGKLQLEPRFLEGLVPLGVDSLRQGTRLEELVVALLVDCIRDIILDICIYIFSL